MDNRSANDLFNLELMEQLKSYVAMDSSFERQMILPSVHKSIESLQESGMCDDIFIHYITTVLEFMKIHEGVNIAQIFPDILKIVELVYPDRKQYCRKLTQQIIIMISKTDMWLKTKI